MSMMRAAVVDRPGHVTIAQVPLPEPAPNQVRIRVEGCGVCASNLTPWSGPDWMDFPTAPGGLGHEGWGRIDRLGAEVEGLAEGQRVCFLGERSYAEFDVADAKSVVPLTGALENRAFPGEAFGCAMNIFARSRIEPGQTVAIVGIGFLGALLTRLASRAGARVIAVSRRPSSLSLARRMGAAETVTLAADADTVGAVGALTSGAMCDRVIETVGKQSALDVASALVRERGLLVIAGYHQDGPRTIDLCSWNWRGIDVVNAHERDPAVYVSGIQASIRAVEGGVIDPDDLLTHRFGLDELGAALDMARDRPEGFVKALVLP